MTKRRVHVYYDGMVQGVGFRFTVEALARRSDVVGWVKNLPDGKVELLCEGEEGVLIEFLRKTKDAMQRYVHNAEVSWSEPTGEFDSFNIRFY